MSVNFCLLSNKIAWLHHYRFITNFFYVFTTYASSSCSSSSLHSKKSSPEPPELPSLCFLIRDTDPFEPHYYAIKYTLLGSTTIKFLFPSMPIVESNSKNIILPSGGLKKDRSDQILLLFLLSRHNLLVSFAPSILGILIWLRLLQRRKANDLELPCIFSRRKYLNLSPSCEDIKQVV